MQTGLGHPLPDLPVRSNFFNDGSFEIRVEVDPRSFEDDPEAEGYLMKGLVDQLTDEENKELHQQANEYIDQRLDFVFNPVGEQKPDFIWSWRKLGDESDLIEIADEAVLVGSWKGRIPGEANAYQVRAHKLGPGKMGVPLNVVFLNSIEVAQAERYAVLFPGEDSFEFDVDELVGKADSSGWWSIFLSEIKRGFLHVVPLGLDHILFVLGVFLMTREWKPLLLQISAFTVAHTITLWLASAGWVNLSPEIVEPIIAASIVAVALENIFHRKYTHWRLLIVFVFGLIHGLGFAGVMATKLDSTTALIVGLLGINIGVELGQLAVIAVALIATCWIAGKEKYRRWVVVPGSILIAIAGVWWVIERTIL